jgi:hypothetical protein
MLSSQNGASGLAAGGSNDAIVLLPWSFTAKESASDDVGSSAEREAGARYDGKK